MAIQNGKEFEADKKNRGKPRRKWLEEVRDDLKKIETENDDEVNTNEVKRERGRSRKK